MTLCMPGSSVDPSAALLERSHGRGQRCSHLSKHQCLAQLLCRHKVLLCGSWTRRRRSRVMHNAPAHEGGCVRTRDEPIGQRLQGRSSRRLHARTRHARQPATHGVAVVTHRACRGRGTGRGTHSLWRGGAVRAAALRLPQTEQPHSQAAARLHAPLGRRRLAGLPAAARSGDLPQQLRSSLRCRCGQPPHHADRLRARARPSRLGLSRRMTLCMALSRPWLSARRGGRRAAAGAPSRSTTHGAAMQTLRRPLPRAHPPPKGQSPPRTAASATSRVRQQRSWWARIPPPLTRRRRHCWRQQDRRPQAPPPRRTWAWPACAPLLLAVLFTNDAQRLVDFCWHWHCHSQPQRGPQAGKRCALASVYLVRVCVSLVRAASLRGATSLQLGWRRE